MSISEILQLSRKSKNMSLEKLAELTGLSYGKIYRILNGIISNPSPSTVKTIADAMNLDYQFLFKLMGDESTNKSNCLEHTEKNNSLEAYSLPILDWEYCYLAFPFEEKMESGLSDDHETFHRPLENGFALVVDEPHSLVPYFYPGDVLICGPEERQLENSLILYRLPNNTTFKYGVIKRYSKKTCIISLHQQECDQIIFFDDLVQSPIVAVVVKHKKH